MPVAKKGVLALGSLGEGGLLKKIYGSFTAVGNGLKKRKTDGAFGSVILGPGDDCAALRIRAGTRLLLSKDDLVEGTHFERSWAEPGRLAARLLAVNLSDLAAMGWVKPLGCLVSAGFPAELPAEWALGFLRGLKRASSRWSVPVLGGNLARSQRIYLSMTIVGSGESRLILRGGARPGDILAGVGPLGEASAGLDMLRRGGAQGRAALGGRPCSSPGGGGDKVPRWARSLARSFWEPVPRLEEARRLAPFLTSLMDNSDGLLSTARTLAESSGVRLRLSLAEAPASRPLLRFAWERGLDLRRHQALGGEDYGLVFTLPARRWEEARRRVSGIYRLGEAGRGRGVESPWMKGKPFEHFR
ncbi:MAG: thiamine-phosphate kinase [Elusimicrobiota bacterium]